MKTKKKYEDDKKYPKTVILSGKILNNIEAYAEGLERNVHYVLVKTIEGKFK